LSYELLSGNLLGGWLSCSLFSSSHLNTIKKLSAL
jgi:hypothetical protein